MLKRIICILCAAVLSVGMCSCGKGGSSESEEMVKHSEFDDGKMRKDMSAMDYRTEMGIGINLGNTLESYWEDKSNKTTGAQIIGENTPLNYETCWGAVETTQECIDGIKAEGFSTVRIPVYWGNMMEDDEKYEINDEYFDRVTEIIDYCRKDGLYVVLNIHHYDEFIVENKSKEEALKIFDNLWTQIAEEYKDYSDYLIFEGFNENVGTVREEDNFSEDEIYDYVNQLNQTFVDAVRSTGGNNQERPLIASGYWTNIDNTTNEKFKMPEDSAEDKLMVSVHYIDNACYWTNQVGGEYWLDYSKSQCELLKEAFTDKGIPVFVGECTSIYEQERFVKNAEYNTSPDCLSVILNMAADYGFVPVLWDVNDNFYSRTEFKIKDEAHAQVIYDLCERFAK
ncbi:glycoside hydrolase family 5 protein [Ruminococcus sp. Marseille-P6503]|uniref:glycoside hydrolase family 5 protein n=1 Tax=Ruminococcus sp. Marseille-P6503 TaxID=2364796 RepID=UPI000F54248B|nr:glycoside hydrolase family 5 protein [Ruminococcus sp. Marseille-P6503]